MVIELMVVLYFAAGQLCNVACTEARSRMHACMATLVASWHGIHNRLRAATPRRYTCFAKAERHHHHVPVMQV